MGRKSKSEYNSPFEYMMHSMLPTHVQEAELQKCMKTNIDVAKDSSMRFRIFALAFLRKFTLEEVNRRLQEAGYAKLYARNYWEAILIYTYSNGLSYAEFQELAKKAKNVYKKVREQVVVSSALTMNDLKEYVKMNSDESSMELRTQHITKSMEMHILESKDTSEFLKYLKGNINKFSIAREKTRYYFCKYLLWYLTDVMERMLESSDASKESKDEKNEYNIIRGLTQLREQKTTSREGKVDFLMNKKISPAAIFDEICYYYYYFVIKDWSSILLDDILMEQDAWDDLDYDEDECEEYRLDRVTVPMKRVAQYVRERNKFEDQQKKKKSVKDLIHKNAQKSEQAWINWDILSDEEVLELEEENLTSVYIAEDNDSREGERQFRYVLFNRVDLDRTGLLCYLLFFAIDMDGNPRAHIPEDQRLSKKRVNEILKECGYGELNAKHSFDKFVLDYLTSKHAETVLQNLIIAYANEAKNSPLFKVYMGLHSWDEKEAKEFGYQNSPKNKNSSKASSIKTSAARQKKKK